MKRTAAKGQTVDDLLRRSAGIPAAFLALFLAEPEGAPKKLLPAAMRWLIDLAKSFLARSITEVDSGQINTYASSVDRPDRSLGGVTKQAVEVLPKALKSRDEGVVPTVHAFNVMRVTFHDTNLATDTSGFCGEGLIIAIQAFSSRHWEVRNAATLAFTALVHRTVGFLNVQKRESARRSITGFEFFHRYPALHPFLLQELRSATLQLEQGGAGGGLGRGGKLSKTLHPSLGPVLIILSRLKPSIINSSADDWLSPSAFMPYVTRCATQSNLKVRILASRALVSLVAANNLPCVLHELAEALPRKQLQGEPKVVVESSTQEYLYTPSDTMLYTTSGGTEHSSGRRFSFNTVHGILLQIQSLLTSNCANLPGSSMRKEIVSLLSLAMKSCVWLGKARLCRCPMVTGAFLQVIQGLVEVEETYSSAASPAELWRFLIQMSAACLDDTSKWATDKEEIWDSTRVALRERAGQLYFKATLMRWPPEFMCHANSRGLEAGLNETDEIGNLLSCSRLADLRKHEITGDLDDNFSQRLKDCLFDPMYEVRLAVLKVLNGFLDLVELKHHSKESVNDVHCILGWVFCCLQPMLMDCLKVETHTRCIRRVLQSYFTLCMLRVKIQNETSSVGLEGTTFHGFQSDFPFNRRPGDLLGGTMLSSSVSKLEIWSQLLRLFRTTKQVKTREVVVRCLGGCIRQITEGTGKILKPGDSSCTHQGNEPGKLEYWNFVKEAVSVWIELIQRHSAANEPVTLRRATAEAIVASGLLEEAEWVGPYCLENWACHEPYKHDWLTTDGISNGGVETQQEAGGWLPTDGISNGGVETQKETGGLMDVDWYAKAVLDVWLTCIKLLEDEDLDLRERLAVAVLRVVSSVSDRVSGLVASDFVPAQVERVIQFSFEFLTSQFGHSLIYLNCLAGWVLKGVDDVSLMTKNGDLVRRLFDKELDNHHEEGLLFTQLCCLHLDNLLNDTVEVFGSGKSPKTSRGCEISRENHKYGLSGFVKYWRMKFLRRARFCVERCMIVEGSLQWLGGITNHPDAFRALYPLLLGLLTFTGPSLRLDDNQCWTASNKPDELSVGLIELAEMMKPLISNPLIANLLLRVLKRYEAQLGIQLGACALQRLKGSVCLEDFDPMFLLK